SGSIIILYLFSIISTCYYTPRLECQPCQEPKMSTMYGSSTLSNMAVATHISKNEESERISNTVDNDSLSNTPL
ncbi:MAG: hypothetical protein WBF33_31025, partial [Candidatus Nitrosopolaris sp.]